jgi:hypothetical protein
LWKPKLLHATASSGGCGTESKLVHYFHQLHIFCLPAMSLYIRKLRMDNHW